MGRRCGGRTGKFKQLRPWVRVGTCMLLSYLLVVGIQVASAGATSAVGE